jgi:hypothetical protein
MTNWQTLSEMVKYPEKTRQFVEQSKLSQGGWEEWYMPIIPAKSEA